MNPPQVNPTEEEKQEMVDKVEKLIDEITLEISQPLSSSSTPAGINILREQIAYAESNGAVIARAARKVTEYVDALTVDAIREMQAEGTEYDKAVADDKRRLIKVAIHPLGTILNLVEDMEKQLERRCSVGQSFLKSIATEQQGSWNNGSNATYNNNETNLSKGEKF